jgi:hypothetical protein
MDFPIGHEQPEDVPADEARADGEETSADEEMKPLVTVELPKFLDLTKFIVPLPKPKTVVITHVDFRSSPRRRSLGDGSNRPRVRVWAVSTASYCHLWVTDSVCRFEMSAK